MTPRPDGAHELARRRWLVIALDAVMLVLLLVAVAVADSGGGVFRLGGVRISMQSPWRPLLWALGVGVVRLAIAGRTGPFGRSRAALAQTWGFGAPLDAERGSLPNLREIALVTIALAVAIAIVFHQQLVDLFSIPDYGDPLFSMWRLAWVAHQVIRDPAHLFDANIFHPLSGTLTYSDSMLLPALVAAPLIWIGVPVGIVYQLLFFGALVLSGAATYLLARGLNFPATASWIAALLFALCQYRIEHYSHLELQVAPWMPLALLGAHRALTDGRPRDFVLLALAVAAQWYSSMYYGLFLTAFAGVFVAVLTVAGRPGWRRPLGAVAAILLGVALVLPLARVYKSTEAARGTRSESIVRDYSARPLDWLQPNTRSRWYRDVHVVKREGERELFPNVTPMVLAGAGLLPPLTPTRLALLVGGLFAFDGSLGFNGHWYPVAYEHLSPMKSMRVPARLAILVHLSLALLAGVGAGRLVDRVRSPSGRQAALGIISIVFVVEAMPDLRLVPLWREPPSLYASLGPDSGAILFEYPVHPHAHYFGENLPYMYFSTWHWTKMVNGYSGFAPSSYHDLAVASGGFPEGASVTYLQGAGVTHVGLHCALWFDNACEVTMRRLEADSRFRLAVSTTWQGKPARLYELAR